MFPDMKKNDGGLRIKGLRKKSAAGIPLVSIVTVVYNGAAHLEETILSVVDQDYGNLEYIIVDGGSTDGTLDIIKKYEHKIDYWVSEADKGIYDAMNKGIWLAEGELIGIINADDCYCTGTVRTVVEKSLKHSEAHVFHGDMEFLHTSGVREIWRSKDTLTAYDVYRMPVNHATVFVRAGCYKECGYFNTRYRIAADYDLVLKFLLDCRLNFHYIHTTMAFMRGGGASNAYSLATLRDFREILRTRRVPRIVALRGIIGYLRLIFLQSCKKIKPLSYVFSFFRALRAMV